MNQRPIILWLLLAVGLAFWLCAFRDKPFRTLVEAEVMPASSLSLSGVQPRTLNPIKSAGVIPNSKKSRDIQAELRNVQIEVPTDLSRAKQHCLIRRWVETDAAAAALWVEQMPLGAARTDLLLALARIWSDLDFTAASRWARGLGHPADQESAIASVAYETVRASPLAALQLAEELPHTSARDALFHHAARQWAEQDGAQATEWANQLGDQALRASLLGDIAVAWSNSDPAAAATMAMEAVPPGRLQDNAVVGIVQRWAQQDAAQAAAWVELFPDGAMRDASVENLVRLWTEEGWEAPAQWLASLRDGPLRDSAVEFFVRDIALLEPTAALAWAGTISEVSRRERSSALVTAKLSLSTADHPQ